MSLMSVAVAGLVGGMLIALVVAPLVLTWEIPTGAATDSATPGSVPEARGLFASPRERRLWSWAAVVVITIYSTIGIVPQIAGTLLELGVAGLGTTVAPIAMTLLVYFALRRWRPNRGELGAAIGVAAVYVMTLSRQAFHVRGHLVEYGLVAVLIHEALYERRRSGRRVPAPWLLAVVLTALLGLLDESLQSLHPDRVYSTEDLFINSVAAVAGVAAALTMRLGKRLFEAWERRWV